MEAVRKKSARLNTYTREVSWNNTIPWVSSSGTMARNACGKITSRIDCHWVMPNASEAED
ncbi:hypothetical protein D3C81_2274300 [compost metagenome]